MDTPLVCRNCSRLLCLCLLCFWCVVSAACGIGTGGGKVSIIGRTITGQIKGVGNQDLLIGCMSGEQLVGGGYSIQKPGSDASVPNIVAEASYPDTSTPTIQWHVTFFNPDGMHIGDVIAAYAYCLTTPNFPVGVSVQGTSSSRVDFGTLSTLTVQCPSGNAVLGGGYMTNHLSNASAFNAGIFASAPLLDNSKPAQARGWMLQVYGYDPTTPLLVTGYVLCASMNLTPALPAASTPISAPPTRFVEQQSPVCGINQLTIGGGYILSGTPQLSKAIYYDGTVPDLTAWSVKATLTFGLSLQTWAACVNVPTS